MVKAKKNIKNLVFEGGGVLGIAYGGVLAALTEFDLIKGVDEAAGSSIGSIAALAVACRASKEFIEKYIGGLDIPALFDGSRYKIKAFYDINKDLGWAKGAAFTAWLEEMLTSLCGKGDITFEEIKAKFGTTLYITGTSITAKKLRYFSPETTPKMSVALAIRISTSIPYIFAPVELSGEIFVDGGWLNNYPISIFDTDNGCQNPEETLGFMLVDRAEILAMANGSDDRFYDKANSDFKVGAASNTNNYNILTYSFALFETMFRSSQETFIERDDLRRTILIDTGNVSSLNFNISSDKREELYRRGYETTKEYLKAALKK